MNKQLPTLQELRSDLDVKIEQNQLNVLLNAEPVKEWVHQHPIFKNVKYLPIERVEYLLTRIFLKWNVEVKNVQTIANSVVVTVRLFYQDVFTDQMLWQDGIGAAPIQTDKGAGASDFNAVKSDSVMKAAPAAESYAIKDAAEKIGKLFGKDLNRADKIMYDSLLDLVKKEDKYQEMFNENNETK
jgi:hypothetical protein